MITITCTYLPADFVPFLFHEEEIGKNTGGLSAQSLKEGGGELVAIPGLPGKHQESSSMQGPNLDIQNQDFCSLLLPLLPATRPQP